MCSYLVAGNEYMYEKQRLKKKIHKNHLIIQKENVTCNQLFDEPVANLTIIHVASLQHISDNNFKNKSIS